MLIVSKKQLIYLCYYRTLNEQVRSYHVLIFEVNPFWALFQIRHWLCVDEQKVPEKWSKMI